MFGWLADLLIKTPIAGSGCACCEAKKEQLKQMQKAILDGDLNTENKKENSICTCEESAECSCNENKNDFSMTSSIRYRL